jgi:hypothetical protein
MFAGSADNPGKIIWDDRAKCEFTIQARQHYSHEDYAVQQLLVPDRAGRFFG